MKPTRLSESTSPALVSAEEAGLSYINDQKEGITRNGKKGKFKYSYKGKFINDEKILTRIKKLVIPPAWKNVWISPSSNSHLQATGYDIKGRKQYKYHADWDEVRNRTKFDRLINFAESLSLIRAKNRKNLKLNGLSKLKVASLVITILDKAYIRVGNEQYKNENNTFGLTTLRDKHVDIKQSKIIFNFIAKSGKPSEISIENKYLAKLVKKCKEIPGFHLFQYYDENQNRQELSSTDVNNYLKSITGEDFTAKDFRTWGGTVMAYSFLLKCADKCSSKKDRSKAIVDCIKEVSKKLNNTAAVCRKYYVHPDVIYSYESGNLKSLQKKKRTNSLLTVEEESVLYFLKSSLKYKKAI